MLIFKASNWTGKMFCLGKFTPYEFSIMSLIFLETKQVRYILNQWNADIASKVPGNFFNILLICQVSLKYEMACGRNIL